MPNRTQDQTTIYLACFKQGYAAFKRGASLDDNPHRTETSWEAWNDGWAMAKHDSGSDASPDAA